MNGHGATLLTYWATALHEEVAPADSECLQNRGTIREYPQTPKLSRKRFRRFFIFLAILASFFFFRLYNEITLYDEGGITHAIWTF